MPIPSVISAALRLVRLTTFELPHRLVRAVDSIDKDLEALPHAPGLAPGTR
jgi:hypothetical protein